VTSALDKSVQDQEPQGKPFDVGQHRTALHCVPCLTTNHSSATYWENTTWCW